MKTIVFTIASTLLFIGCSKNNNNKESSKHKSSKKISRKPRSIVSYLQPAIKNGGFRMDDYYIWGASVIKVDGEYHMFASRWPKKYGMDGWSNHSEVVRATSKNLLGPYTFKEVVLKKRKGDWDSRRIHNPKIVKVENKFVLYYISNVNDIGYAWSESITGPWKRSEAPVTHFSNPAVVVHKRGNIYLFGRGKRDDGSTYAQAAVAPTFNQDYQRIKKGENLLPGKNQLEDPTVWHTKSGYHMICSDFKGDVTGTHKAGAQYYSSDGRSYKPISTEPVYTRTVVYKDHTKEHFQRRERPFTYVNEKGEVTAFFTAGLPKNGPSRVVAQRVEQYVPNLVIDH